MNDDDRPTLRVGDYVIDREDEAESDEEPSIMLVVELMLKIFTLATIFIVVDASRVRLGVTEFEAMSAAVSTFFNVGPAFGIGGPFESYEPFSWSTKLVMTFLMRVGRIEIIPVLVLLTPSYWRT